MTETFLFRPLCVFTLFFCIFLSSAFDCDLGLVRDHAPLVIEMSFITISSSSILLLQSSALCVSPTPLTFLSVTLLCHLSLRHIFITSHLLHVVIMRTVFQALDMKTT